MPQHEPSNTHPLQENEANKDRWRRTLGGNDGKQLKKFGCHLQTGEPGKLAGFKPETPETAVASLKA